MAETQTNDIQTVRDALFATLRDLSDKNNPMDLDRAKAVNDTAQTLINTAKVEVDYIRATGGKGTGFINDQKTLPPGMTRHICK